MEDARLITMLEAAKIAQVLPQTIYRATKDGRLPYTTLYGKKLVTRANLQRYIDGMGVANGHRAKTGQVEAKRRRKSD